VFISAARGINLSELRLRIAAHVARD